MLIGIERLAHIGKEFERQLLSFLIDFGEMDDARALGFGHFEDCSVVVVMGGGEERTGSLVMKFNELENCDFRYFFYFSQALRFDC